MREAVSALVAVISLGLGLPAAAVGLAGPEVLCGQIVNTSLPVLSGTGQPGSTLTTTPGTWRDGCTNSFAYSYAWSGPNGSGATYAVGAADLGQTITVTVTATDDQGGEASATSNGIIITASGGGGSPSPSVGLTAGPNPIQAGQSSVLTLVTNASRCDPTTWNPGPIPKVNGSFSTGILSATTTFAVTCYSSAGLAASASVTVSVTGAGPGDADGDGVPDSADNCGRQGPDYLVANTDQADTDHDGYGDLCDQTPFPGELVVGPLGSVTTSSPDPVGGFLYNCNPPYRYKVQTYHQVYNQSVINKKVLAYDVTFGACYKAGGGIAWIKNAFGDGSYSFSPWTWKDDNASGYPAVTYLSHQAVIRFKGTAAICVFRWGCGPDRHPWVTLTFSDTNTMSVDAGVS